MKQERVRALLDMRRLRDLDVLTIEGRREAEGDQRQEARARAIVGGI